MKVMSWISVLMFQTTCSQACVNDTAQTVQEVLVYSLFWLVCEIWDFDGVKGPG